MLDKEIIDILTKYKKNNLKEIENINSHLENIRESFNNIHYNMVTEFSEELIPVENDGNENMLQDIRVIKKYIKEFDKNFLPINSSTTDKQPLELYLISDEVCPLCKSSMKKVEEWYRGEHDNQPKKIHTLKCNCCSRKYVTFDKIKDIKVDSKTGIILYNDYLHLLDIYDSITIQIKKSINKCIDSKHNISDIIVQVPVVNEAGEINFETLPAIYCEECKKYIVLKNDFDNISDIILCEVIDETIEYKKYSDGFTFEDRQSKLYRHGYHAQSKNALSDEQRHTILLSVLEAKIMTKFEICSYLNNLTQRYHNNVKFENAVKKWKVDREYVKNYKQNKDSQFLVDKIVLSYSYKKSPNSH